MAVLAQIWALALPCIAAVDSAERRWGALRSVLARMGVTILGIDSVVLGGGWGCGSLGGAVWRRGALDL